MQCPKRNWYFKNAEHHCIISVLRKHICYLAKNSGHILAFAGTFISDSVLKGNGRENLTTACRKEIMCLEKELFVERYLLYQAKSSIATLSVITE